jgi:hypothetical protein
MARWARRGERQNLVGGGEPPRPPARLFRRAPRLLGSRSRACALTILVTPRSEGGRCTSSQVDSRDCGRSAGTAIAALIVTLLLLRRAALWGAAPAAPRRASTRRRSTHSSPRRVRRWPGSAPPASPRAPSTASIGLLVAVAGAESSFGLYLCSVDGDQATSTLSTGSSPRLGRRPTSARGTAVARSRQASPDDLYYGDALHSIWR